MMKTLNVNDLSTVQGGKLNLITCKYPVNNPIVIDPATPIITPYPGDLIPIPIVPVDPGEIM